MLDLESRFEARHSGICSIAAAIAGAATIGGALISSSGAQSAANTEASAANQAAATQLSMYNQTRSDLMPYMSTGTSALNQLASLWGLAPGGNGQPNAAAATSQLTQFPGYQFGLQQGQTALDQDAASKGLLLSGAQSQAATQFGQQYAMQQAWNPYITQLNSLASVGEDAGAKVGNLGTQAASGAGTAQLAAGQAGAQGTLGVTNSLTSGLQNALLSYQLYGGGGSGSFNPGQMTTFLDPNAVNAAFNPAPITVS